MHRSWCVVTVAAFLIAAALVGPGVPAAGAAGVPDAAIRVARFSVGGGALDVRLTGYAGASRHLVVPPGGSPTVEGYAALPPGPYVVTVRSGAAAPAVLIVDAQPGAAYTLGVVAAAGTVRALLIHDDSPRRRPARLGSPHPGRCPRAASRRRVGVGARPGPRWRVRRGHGVSRGACRDVAGGGERGVRAASAHRCHGFHRCRQADLDRAVRRAPRAFGGVCPGRCGRSQPIAGRAGSGWRRWDGRGDLRAWLGCAGGADRKSRTGGRVRRLGSVARGPRGAPAPPGGSRGGFAVRRLVAVAVYLAVLLAGAAAAALIGSGYVRPGAERAAGARRRGPRRVSRCCRRARRRDCASRRSVWIPRCNRWACSRMARCSRRAVGRPPAGTPAASSPAIRVRPSSPDTSTRYPARRCSSGCDSFTPAT